MLIGVSKRESRMLDWMKVHTPLLLLLYALVRYAIDLPLNLTVLAICAIVFGLWNFAKTVLSCALEGAEIICAATKEMRNMLKWYFSKSRKGGSDAD